MALSFVEIQPSSNGQTVYDNLSLNFVTTSDIGVSLIKANGTVVVATTGQFTVSTSPTTKVTLTDSAFFNQVTTHHACVRLLSDCARWQVRRRPGRLGGPGLLRASYMEARSYLTSIDGIDGDGPPI